MDERPDAALVSAALAGEKDAFCALVRRYQDFAYGLAVGMLSDFDLAQDVVQEAFLAAYCSLRKLKDPARFGGWLRGIVRHTAHRAVRDREHLRRLTARLSHVMEAFDEAPPPDRAAEEAERRRVVRAALERLQARNREVVSLYYVDGLSYGEIAGFLSVTQATVKGRLQRGRAQLREELRMVEDTFRERRLPDDFASEIQRLLEAWAERGVEQRGEVERLVEIGAPAVEPLLQALDDPRAAVRRGAANALCAIGDPRALDPILEGWRASRLAFRIKDVLAIRGAREALLRALREGERHDQWWAMEVLRHARGDDEVFDAVYEIFRRPGRSRAGTVEALCDIRPGSAEAVLVEALDSPDLTLRRRAPWAALRRGLALPIEACMKAFVGGVYWWGRLCAGSLVLKHGEEGVKALERVMRTGSPDERATAAMALTVARESGEEAFEALKGELLRGLQDRKWVKAVSRALAGHYPRQSASWIEAEPELVATSPDVAWVLARHPTAQVGPAIERLSRDATPSIRAAALRALGRRRGAALLPELRTCLREGGPGKVTREAFRQMLRLRDAAMPTAEAMLDSEHWTERKAAVGLLRRWGRLSPERRARATADPNVAVRMAAG